MTAVLYGILTCLASLVVSMSILRAIDIKASGRPLKASESYVAWSAVVATGLLPILVTAYIFLHS